MNSWIDGLMKCFLMDSSFHGWIAGTVPDGSQPLGLISSSPNLTNPTRILPVLKSHIQCGIWAGFGLSIPSLIPKFRIPESLRMNGSELGSTTASNPKSKEDPVGNGHEEKENNPFAEYMWMENEEDFNRQVRLPGFLGISENSREYPGFSVGKIIWEKVAQGRVIPSVFLFGIHLPFSFWDLPFLGSAFPFLFGIGFSLSFLGFAFFGFTFPFLFGISLFGIHLPFPFLGFAFFGTCLPFPGIPGKKQEDQGPFWICTIP